MQNARLDEAQTGIKIAGWSINNLRYADDTTLIAESNEELKIKLPTSVGSSEKQESSRKTSTSALLTMPKSLAMWITTNCGKFFKTLRWEYQTTLLASWEICMQVKEQQLELGMEQYAMLCYAKSLQSCPTLCDPIEGSPPGSPVSEILQARTLEWVAISFSNAWKWKVKAKSLSRVWLLATPWTAAHQAPPSMGLSRKEYWSGVPLP